MWGKVGECMLIGQFRHNLDDKNRLVVPTKYREILKEHMIITHGIEKCLYVYSLYEWEQLISKLDILPFTKKDARTFTRAFFSGANDCTIDKSGRIVVTDTQKKYADLEKECIILGVNNRLEIWSVDVYEKYINENKEELEDIAESLFEVTNAL